MNQPLSRLNADFFTKNLHYAVSFWLEHKDNVQQMLERLLDSETLEKLGKNAAYLTITFNHTTGWVDKDYNSEEISNAYIACIRKSLKDKTFLFKFMAAYFEVYEQQMDSFDAKIQSLPRNKEQPANSVELLNIKKVFEDKNGCPNLSNLDKYAEMLLGPGFDALRCRANFYPQLILFFLRFLDIYDSSLKGTNAATL